MKSKNPQKRKQESRIRRKARISTRIDASRLRLVVFRSARHTYAQVIDDAARKTLVAASDKDTKGIKAPEGHAAKTATAWAVGKVVGERAIAKGITQVVFDRSGFAYHGRVKAVADGARAAGLEF